MKFTADFESGLVLSAKPENLQLIDNGGKGSVLVVKTEHTLVPLTFFSAVLATPEEIKARAEKAAAAPKQ
jgi:hypothetical protein